jgi:serine/threonine-protein kinase HipA
MSTAIRYLRIYLHTPTQGKRGIGYLSAYGDLLRISFDTDYIQDNERPTLSQDYIGATPEETIQILSAIRDVRLARQDGKLPVYFQNLLPESHNRERLANERHCSVDDEFELLAAAGHDLMGAVEVEPVPMQEGVPETVRRWHATLGLDVLEPGFVEFPIADAASLPGVVTKFSAIKEGRRYVIKRRGFAGDYILKLPTSLHPDLVQNEMTCYRLAHATGIQCAHAEIISKADADLPEHIPYDDILVVKRFDRSNEHQRIHMEEFAQVFGFSPKHKYGKDMMRDYATILATLEQRSSQPSLDVPEFVRRFVTFILMGNTDAHLKNWAIIYPDGKHLQLSPMYDPVCIIALFKTVPDSDYGLNRSIDKKLKVFSWEDLEALLKMARVSRVQRLMAIAKQTVKLAQDKWPALLLTAPDNMRESITERLHGGVCISQKKPPPKPSHRSS